MAAELRPDNLTRIPDAHEPQAAHEPWLKERLAWFSDLKFGLFVHWGIYSLWGCTESWPLVAEEPWARDPQLPAWIESRHDLSRFQQAYRRLNERFNPRAFDPAAWAATAQAAGMKYFDFTTKHHDGFCLWDTRTTDYRVTHPSCPFHTHRYADVTRALFDHFRAAGMAISCYFSKSDWHSPFYWKPDLPAPTRDPNYIPRAEPQIWDQFVHFTHAQLLELMSGYGPIDVLWLDGGQVRPPEQDIRMDDLMQQARRHQPGLIVVDRTVGGPHENILTPEQQVPAAPLNGVWETSATLGTSFSYKPNDEYKSVRQTIHLLVDVVSKGGNLLLGIGADAHGQLPPEAIARLRGVGDWLKTNGEAIYATRQMTPFTQSDEALDVRFTRKDHTLYAIILAKPMQQRPPARFVLRDIHPPKGAQVTLLDVDEPVNWVAGEGGAEFSIPTAQLDQEPARPAWVLKMRGGSPTATG